MAGVSLFRFALAGAALIVSAATAAGVVFAGGFVASGAKAAPAAHVRTPSAIDVANELEFATNAQAKTAHGGTIGHVSCVAGDPGNYACSYVRAVGSTRTCAVAIVQWTPNETSSYQVQKAGRVALAAAQCGPVTKVLHVLGTSG